MLGRIPPDPFYTRDAPFSKTVGRLLIFMAMRLWRFLALRNGLYEPVMNLEEECGVPLLDRLQEDFLGSSPIRSHFFAVQGAVAVKANPPRNSLF